MVGYSSGMVGKVGEADGLAHAADTIMHSKKQADTRDWVGIRRAYEQSDETIKDICLRFGVTKSALENRYRRDLWISRQASAARRRRSTLARLFVVLEGQVTKLANSDGETLGDKEANQLTEIIKNFDKLTGIENADMNNGGPAQKKDLRDLRDKLAKRIDQFKRR